MENEKIISEEEYNKLFIAMLSNHTMTSKQLQDMNNYEIWLKEKVEGVTQGETQSTGRSITYSTPSGRAVAQMLNNDSDKGLASAIIVIIVVVLAGILTGYLLLNM